MQDFLIQSLIASVVLTVLINIVPRLFPQQARKAEKRLHEKIEETFREDDARREQGQKPRVKVFFPWKAMLVISLILTVVLNLVGLFVTR